ncbi:MAG: type II secretion system protein GspM [Pseudomonadota bacterium]
MTAVLATAGQRLAALGLLALVLALAWVELISPLWARNASLAEEIEDGRKLLARYERIAVNRGRVDDLLQEISVEPDLTEFLTGESEAVAVAGLQDKLRTLARENRAKLLSASPLKTRTEDGLQLAGLRLHLSGRLKNIHKLIFEIESGNPRLFIFRANVRRIPGRKSSKDPGPTRLEVRMDTYGVLWPGGS